VIRSLSSGVSGLRSHQIRMDVIANNIANVNTTSFKAGRVNFHEMLSQDIRGASASTLGVSAINPAQVGLGVQVSAIDAMFTQGAFLATNRVTDLGVDGNGFFALGKIKEVDAAEADFTYYIQKEDGTWAARHFKIEEKYYTRDGTFYIDKDGFLVSSTGYVVLGKVRQVTVDADSKPTGFAEDGGDPLYRKAGDADGDPADDPAPINLLEALEASFPDQNFSLETIKIDRHGNVVLNGNTEIIEAPQIQVDNYPHPEGLVRMGENVYAMPNNDVTIHWGTPDTGGRGKVVSGVLEMSNVDLSVEFANMITTQRGYQASARVITVSDEMLGELINLKR